MIDQPIEDKNILGEFEDNLGNKISFHLDRIQPYKHRYLKYIKFNDISFPIGKIGTTTDANTFKELLKRMLKKEEKNVTDIV